MISYIKGELAEVTTDAIIVENKGMGYQIFTPLTVLSQMPAVGSTVKVYTYLYVREDVLCLYGFLTRDDLQVFKLLITVNGIGPKGALGILSAISTDELRFAVMAADAKTISKAPGIGQKTAQRLIIELKDKLKLTDIMGEQETAVRNDMGLENQRNEAALALVELGYSQAEAMRAIRQANITEDMTVNEMLKAALRQMMTI